MINCYHNKRKWKCFRFWQSLLFCWLTKRGNTWLLSVAEDLANPFWRWTNNILSFHWVLFSLPFPLTVSNLISPEGRMASYLPRWIYSLLLFWKDLSFSFGFICSWGPKSGLPLSSLGAPLGWGSTDSCGTLNNSCGDFRGIIFSKCTSSPFTETVTWKQPPCIVTAKQ